MPRWSTPFTGAAAHTALSPAWMASLTKGSSWVSVGRPLSWSGPRLAFGLFGLSEANVKLQVPSLTSHVYGDGVTSIDTGETGYSFIVTDASDGLGISIWRLEHRTQKVRHVGNFVATADTDN